MESAGRQVFRPRRVLAAIMGVAGILWVVMLMVLLLKFQNVPTKTYLTVIFFIALFAVSLTYYARTRIVVDARGITYRGMVRTRSFSFTEIRKVDVLPGPVTVYAIRTNGCLVNFTSFFQHHRRLAALLVEPAKLAPMVS